MLGWAARVLDRLPAADLPLPALANRADAQAQWEAARVIVDDLASQVLVLNVRAGEDHVVADWLRDAAGFGIPFRLTLHQLSLDPVTPLAREVYVCENPAVPRAAASELAAATGPGAEVAEAHRRL